MSRATETSTASFLSKSNLLKVVISLSLFAFLFFLGQRGRREAVLQGDLEELRVLRSQLFAVLDSDTPLTSPFLSGGRPPTNQLSSTPEFQNLVSVLRSQTQRFDPSSFPASAVGPSLELQLTSASVALAERRYSDALSLLTESHEQTAGSLAERNRSLLAEVLRIRAASFFGLQQFGQAAPRFQRLVDLDSNNSEAKIRLADCYWAGGNVEPALALYTEVAEAYRSRGDVFALQEKLQPALEHYQASSSIFARLLQHESRPEIATAWALSIERFGDGLVLLGNAAAAIASYENAIEMRNRLLPNDQSPALRSVLASDLLHRGGAYLIQRQFDRATNDFLAASTIWSDLSVSQGPHFNAPLARTLKLHADIFAILKQFDSAKSLYDRAIDLISKSASESRSSSMDLIAALNNRGVVSRLQGNADAALVDFSRSIDAVKSSGATSRSNASTALEISLDLLIGCGPLKETDITVRTRSTQEPSPADLTVSAAITFRNRAFAKLEKNDQPGALVDLQSAAGTLEKTVEHDGRFDLSAEYSKCLQPLAWLLATSTNDQLRDGSKANALALKACEFSDWKAHASLEALAAASAEIGNFDDAIKWQTRAIENAPTRIRPDLHQRLLRYQSRQPWRTIPRSL